MYYNGLGVEKDLEKAKELYSQAAPSNKQAQLLLEELQDEMAAKQTWPYFCVCGSILVTLTTVVMA